MGTIRRLAANVRQRRFYWSFWLTFAGLLGFVSAILTIAGKHLSLAQFIMFTGLALLCSAVTNRHQLFDKQLSVDDVLPEAIDATVRTKVHCPCTAAQVHSAKELAANCYSGTVTIDPQNYNAIWAKNPNVLACLTTDSGQFLGYFDVIPLKSSFAEMLIAGKLTEDQLTHDEVFLPSEAASCRYVFVSGLAVLQSDSFVGRRNASLLVWALLKYLDHYYSSTRPTTFALAATKEGDDLLNRFRLNVSGEREGRADHYKLYSLHLTKEEIARRLACLPDWRGLCALDWSQPEAFVLPARRPALPQMHHSALKAAGQ